MDTLPINNPQLLETMVRLVPSTSSEGWKVESRQTKLETR